MDYYIIVMTCASTFALHAGLQTCSHVCCSLHSFSFLYPYANTNDLYAHILLVNLQICQAVLWLHQAVLVLALVGYILGVGVAAPLNLPLICL